MNRDYSRLDAFIREREKDIPPLTDNNGVFAVTNRYLVDEGISAIVPMVKQGGSVLDVGVGRGYAMKEFREKGFVVHGITLFEAESAGEGVEVADMSFLDLYGEEQFDLVWARHCLEHSIFPYFTLSEFYRIMKPQAILYVEVPAPETINHHENNNNHYSVMGRLMWVSLIRRSGFRDVSAFAIKIGFEEEGEGDVYYRFIARKKEGGK